MKVLLCVAVAMLFSKTLNSQTQGSALTPLHEIKAGMTREQLLDTLQKGGYTISNLFDVEGSTEYEICYEGQAVGSVSLSSGRVTRVQQLLYDSARPSQADAASLAEFLYWISYDSSTPVQGKAPNELETRLAAPLITVREFDYLRRNVTHRQLSVDIGGKQFLISIIREAGERRQNTPQARVSIHQLLVRQSK
jgi:hypothetical protein